MKTKSKIPNQIHMFFHCANCMSDKPSGITPRDYLDVEVGWTKKGLQVWCKRCEMSVIDIDLLGQKVDAR